METLKHIFDWFYGLPPTVWAAIIAVCGVMLSNRHARKMIRQQLTHDAEQRQVERTMTLRREVFFGAGDAVTGAMAVIGSLTDLDIATDKLTADFQKQIAALTRVQLVGGDCALEAIAKFTSALLNAYARHSFTRFLLIERQRQMKAAGEPSQKHALSEELFKQQVEFSKSVMDDSQVFVKLLSPALFAVREELSLPIDRARFLAVMDEAWESQIGALREFTDKIADATLGKSAAPGAGAATSIPRS